MSAEAMYSAPWRWKSLTPVVAHLGRDRLVGDTEAAAESAAFIGPVDLDQLEPLDLAQQVAGLREVGLVDPLRRPRVAQAPDGGATVVQADPVRERRPRGRLPTFRSSCRNSTSSRVPARTFRACGVCSIASRWNRTWWTQLPDGPTTVSKSWKQLDEEGFGGGGIVLAAAVGHRLAAAGLIERVLDRAAEPLEELQGRDRPLPGKRRRRNRE